MTSGNGTVLSAIWDVESELEKVQELQQRVQEAASDVSDAFTQERVVAQALYEAEQALDEVLVNEVLDAEYQARVDKSGPLEGLAKTSEAYKAALSKIRTDACSDVAEEEWRLVQQRKRDHLAAQMELERSKNLFTAVRIQCELEAALLRALAR